MKIDYVKVVERAGPVTIDGKSTNVTIKGYSRGKIGYIGGFEDNKMEIKIKIPKLNFDGTYQAVATILGIPINGGGPYKVVFSKIKFYFGKFDKKWFFR